jgi:hypothetical protein
MPDALEYVVRPYQSPNAHGAIIVPSTPTGGHQKAFRQWGAKATLPEVQGVNFNTACCKDELKEQDRTSERIRVYQNGDTSSDNWVDLERAKTMNHTKKDNNTCGDNWDDISGVANQIDNILADFAAFFNQQTGNQPKNCTETWSFKNQPAG